MLASSAADNGIKHRSGHTNDLKIGICSLPP